MTTTPDPSDPICSRCSKPIRPGTAKQFTREPVHLRCLVQDTRLEPIEAQDQASRELERAQAAQVRRASEQVRGRHALLFQSESGGSPTPVDRVPDMTHEADALLAEIEESPTDLARLIRRVVDRQPATVWVSATAAVAWQQRDPDGWAKVRAWLTRRAVAVETI